MLSAANISFSIGEKQILKNISTRFLPGEFSMILGPNGSGKSSFLKVFSGETTRYQGIVLYENEDLRSVKKEVLAKKRGVMSQQPELSFPLPVEEVVMMGRYPHFRYSPVKKDNDICNEVIQKMNLQDFRERNYLTLSGGEKQRVQFARVLAQVWEKPVTGLRYLFLDEPLASLDINYQQEFLQIAKELLGQDTIVIAVMHDINQAIHYSDKLFFLRDGELVAEGKPADVISSRLLKDVFNVDTTIINNPVTGEPLVIYDRI